MNSIRARLKTAQAEFIKKTVTFRMNAELKIDVERFLKRDALSMNGLIVQLLTMYVNEHKNKGE